MNARTEARSSLDQATVPICICVDQIWGKLGWASSQLSLTKNQKSMGQAGLGLNTASSIRAGTRAEFTRLADSTCQQHELELESGQVRTRL